ncbi:hypothetical protein O0I10_006705 [Lichtheimia ornata]|uniref:Uncharacterized protein n=1 Tax=Lichtheimia ornata TaxID=688661 RepID=A0AAD7V1K3_9FUNG|nr:uncharacterized protein O0I10_006705 [Lichtheimia ornata]KAJ8657639.1 hypothetical protein O0I10_006705 [Lichtheimia ornata]
MRFSSSFILLAAIFMFGVTATGDTTSTPPAADGPLLSPETEKKVMGYLVNVGEQGKSILNTSQNNCKAAQAGNYDTCIIDDIRRQAYELGLPVPTL